MIDSAEQIKKLTLMSAKSEVFQLIKQAARMSNTSVTVQVNKCLASELKSHFENLNYKWHVYFGQVFCCNPKGKVSVEISW